MLTRILETVKKLMPAGRPLFDPAVLDDSIALKTGWGPLKSGGTNICTHSLKEISGGRLAFRPTFGYFAFCLVFLLLGMAMLGLAFFSRTSATFQASSGTIPLILFGAIFSVIGGCMIGIGGRPIVFDRAGGQVWRGWGEPSAEGYEREGKKSGILCKPDEIHAIQIVPERVRSKNSSYLSYELNLVLEDGSRRNIVDHGNIGQLRIDAAKLGAYLEVDVWDSTLS